MDRFGAVSLFVRVVDSGSFSAVARQAGVGQPAVSKQIAALETHLGAQLLRRTSRSMTLTDAGQSFYEAAVRLVGDLEAAESLVGRGQFAPSGLVRATVTPVLGRLYIVPKLPAFLARYPEIAVEMSGSERSVNLIEEGVDLAIRNGRLTDSSMIARTVASTPVITVATPAYLARHGTPVTPAELERHSCVVFTRRGEPRPWEYRGGGGRLAHQPSGRFRTTDPEQVRAAVLAGLGLAQAPAWLFAPDIAAGTVCVVLRDYQPDTFAISIVHPGGRRLPTKVRVFADFLTEVFARDTSLAFQQAQP